MAIVAQQLQQQTSAARPKGNDDLAAAISTLSPSTETKRASDMPRSVRERQRDGRQRAKEHVKTKISKQHTAGEKSDGRKVNG